MARTDERFREAYNTLLDTCASLRSGASLPAESALSKQLEVSRTVIRSALSRLDETGIIQWNGREKRLLRAPTDTDYIEVQTEAISNEELEQRFLDWVLRFDVPPRTPLNVSDLSRRFEVSAHALHEFLASLSRFGLVQRRPKGGWQLLGFTREYAVELFELRTMVELNAISQLVALPEEHPIWHKLDQLERDHLRLAEQIDRHYHDFSVLDERFHTILGSVTRNRFIDQFKRVISLVFHYHYQWDKKDERERNEAAIQEHLRMIRAIRTRDEKAALAAARDHLNTSKKTLLSSLKTHAHA
ncbi:GntR family transcriptional regulator [Nitrincola sp. MINF-07-Sa-05]|uniref:GntR family transcriptional regulator n=1 Tax=Nitrincola salilacus TaxID=3400273 RepID=UPI003917EFD5